MKTGHYNLTRKHAGDPAFMYPDHAGRYCTPIELQHIYAGKGRLARGGGSHGDIRWNAAPGGGADAGFPKDREESARENQLETGSSRDLPVQWTVVAIAMGWG
ncbi:protein of unknown function [Methanoculleus bourgensis]|uniref:Uncharacterized protein n=1 Tax=Methanoculleus bourgensis TaxID=83986 RepID=A0A0X3BMI9_9EURY|nr:protein of unknown function [Methanoculleus bourgensis]